MTPFEIKKLRDGLVLTQKELAYQLGVSIDTVKSWESGRRKISEPARILLLMLDDGAHTNGYLER